LALGEKWTEQGLVFANFFGDKCCPRRLNRQFDAVIKQAGLPKVRFHDLRQGAATMLLSQGVDVKTISDLLGHSTTRMTLEVYSHVLNSMRTEAADQMDHLLIERPEDTITCG
jgi:integrase